MMIKDSVRIDHTLIKVFKWNYCVRPLAISEQTTGKEDPSNITSDGELCPKFQFGRANVSSSFSHQS